MGPRRWCSVILLGAGPIAAACGGTTISSDSTSADAGKAVDASDGGAMGCVPGRSIACVGPGGCPSNQVCNSSGAAYGPCTCASDAGPEPESGAGTDDGSIADGGHSFYPPLDATTTAPPDDAGSLPAVGSPACEDEGCILCADGYYHCHSFVYPPCPAGLSPSASCTATEVPSEGCFWCPSTGQETGEGWLWQCTGASWSLTIFGCTP